MKVGITGGIGSGKTTICKLFELLGIPVYYSDDRAKALMTESPALVQQVKALFGAEAYFADGKLHRAYLGGIVFNDPVALKQLNGIVHPAVGQDALDWHMQQDAPYTLKEAALLYESGIYRSLDRMITVFAPLPMRIERVMQRDGVDELAVRNRVSKQMLDYDKISLADFVITNNGQQSLIQQVLQIHRQLLEEAQ